MDGIPENVIQKRKSVEVFYVPDTLIDNIIHDGEKEDVRRRNGRRNYVEKHQFNDSPLSITRQTRSGRKIINRFQQLSLNDDSPHKNDETDFQELFNSETEKPDVVPGKLFENNEVDGKHMYSFQTPKRVNGMASKANEVATRTVETPRSKSSNSLCTPNREIVKVVSSKTPYSLRNQIKKRLVDEATKQELDRLLEDSGSEYNPTSSSDSESSDSDSDSAEEFKVQDEEDDKPSPPKKTKKQLKDYIFTSEDYFDRRYSKIMTSGHTLKKLKTPRLAHSQLTLLLKAIPATHKKSIGFLFGGIKKSFKHWLFCFSEGYNVLLYGLGSKRNILSTFHHMHLQNCPVIYVNGYFPDISIKQILDVIASEILLIPNVPAQPHEILEILRDKFKHKNTPRIFVLFSNLDGKPFQNDKSQALLAQLANIEKVHMVASIDHINSALLWDQSKMSTFNFIWEDCTNYEPYLDETSYEGSLMVNWSGGLALASLKNVFYSLTVNSRKVFKILLQHHLENKNKKYSGMHFSELYRQCREGFIVSSDLALRTLLTEFTDHELVKWRKETDHLVITIDHNILKQFKDEVDLDK